MLSFRKTGNIIAFGRAFILPENHISISFQ
jgi:hypothetical protein